MSVPFSRWGELRLRSSRVTQLRKRSSIVISCSIMNYPKLRGLKQLTISSYFLFSQFSEGRDWGGTNLGDSGSGLQSSVIWRLAWGWRICSPEGSLTRLLTRGLRSLPRGLLECPHDRAVGAVQERDQGGASRPYRARLLTLRQPRWTLSEQVQPPLGEANHAPPLLKKGVAKHLWVFCFLFLIQVS